MIRTRFTVRYRGHTMRVDHRFFPVGDLRLHALHFGGEGHPILLLHGVTGHGWLWHGVAGQLTLWGQVLALDLRGHGDSQWASDGRYDTTTLADDVAAVIEQLGEPADVVGLSWGGLVAMRLAGRHPGLVRRVAVLDIPTSFAQPSSDVPSRPYRFAGRRDVLDWERRANPRAAAPLVELVADHSVRPDAGGGLVRKHDERFITAWPFREETYDADWRALSCPVLLLRAADSPVLGVEQFEAMLAAQPGAEGLTIEGSGHLLPLDRPISVADALEGFLHEAALDAAVIGEAREALDIP